MNEETGYNYMNVSDLILWNSQSFIYLEEDEREHASQTPECGRVQRIEKLENVINYQKICMVLL